ncbi:hypothetical protein ZOSMA_54G00900 [Zostera marina]|uniref:NHL repeat-containing protein n=1 Tax=Zostera marina TaxID=29655 RepID=A0A0K9NWZ0_ZOSMR|nr:hypothetical protein ZOSMA_54G00900 [Zostera marina]
MIGLIAGVLSLLLCLISAPPVGAKLVLEDGYDVVTVLDGNKLSDSQGVLHPYSILPAMKKQKQNQNILLLDSVGSIFYSVPLPISQDREIKVLVGKQSSGVVSFAAGYSDGDASTATFNHPKSFAVDATGNVYVADRTNHVVRKISPSGETTTIAGGYSGKTGKIDGPAQNTSFSSDFELVYIPGICALLISDRGNNLIRQLNLKPDDCRNESYPGIGVSSVSIIATLSSVVAFIAGFLARPFVASSSEPHGFGKTWNPYPTKSVKIPPIIYSGIRNGVVSITAGYMFVYKLVGTVFYV